jgi:hypothetical protein
MHITTLKTAALNLSYDQRLKLLCKLLESMKSVNSKEMDELRTAAAARFPNIFQRDVGPSPRANE